MCRGITTIATMDRDGHESGSGMGAQLRLVVAALIGGLVVVTGVMVWLRASGQFGGGVAAGSGGTMAGALVAVLGAVALAAVPAYVLVRMQSLRRLRGMLGETADHHEHRRLVEQAFAQVTIVGAALAEGPGLLGAVVFLLTGEWAVLIAPLLACAGLLAVFPTAERLEAFERAATGPR